MTPSQRGFIVGCTVAAGMVGFATAGFAVLSPWLVLSGSIVIGLIGLIAAGIAGWNSREAEVSPVRPIVIVTANPESPGISIIEGHNTVGEGNRQPRMASNIPPRNLLITSEPEN